VYEIIAIFKALSYIN